MGVLHDYECESCGNVLRDELEHPGRCECIVGETSALGNLICFGEYFITFKFCTSFNQMRDVKGANELSDDLGRRRAFNVVDCPVSRIELGLQNNRGDNGIKSFNPEQTEYYQNKFAIDGDTPKLRKEVLRTRSANLAAEGVTQEAQ